MIATRVRQTALAGGTTTGKVMAAGSNISGELGNGTIFNSREFFDFTLDPSEHVTGLLGATAVAAFARHNLALKDDGTVWAWGDNSSGQLGDGTPNTVTLSRTKPVQVLGINSAIAIAAGSDHSLALLADGTVLSWGKNASGQLGDGTHNNRNRPAKVQGLAQVIAIAAGGDFNLALRADGTVWAWGGNQKGQLGIGSTSAQKTPVLVPSFDHVMAVAAGGAHSLALRADGTVWTWGFNNKGQLGDGTLSDRLTPKSISGSDLGVSFSGVIAILGGGEFSIALTAEKGLVWTWGSNHSGQLGTGTLVDRSSPGLVVGAGTDLVLGEVEMIMAGEDHSMALRAGVVWTWGFNNAGRLGDGTSVDRSTPVQAKWHSQTGNKELQTRDRVISMAGGAVHSLLLVAPANPVWGWGRNDEGQTGNSATFLSSKVPKEIATAKIAISSTAIAAGDFHSLELQADHLSPIDQDPNGCLAWGSDQRGQLGNQSSAGTLVGSPIPVDQSARLKIVAIAAGANHSLALTATGTVLAWGSNERGQLGDNTLTKRNSPVQVLDPKETTPFSDVTAIAAGEAHSLAIRSDGTVWAWGGNSMGELGIGTTVDRKIPAQVQSLQQVTAISGGGGSFSGTPATWNSSSGHSLALRADGTVWAWGRNEVGQLGNNSLNASKIPVQVRSSHDDFVGIKAIAAGGGHNLALRADGTVWAWGRNEVGQLGDNSLQNRVEAVRVQNDAKKFAGVKAIAAGDAHSLAAIAQNGVVFSWGWNLKGQLGDGTNIDESEVKKPVFAGATAIEAGGAHSLAIAPRPAAPGPTPPS
jgi:alpha-tubulin suppressor-like RCC1 family protein